MVTQEKVVVVVGGFGLIGRAVVQKIAATGMQVVVIDSGAQTPENLNNVSSTISVNFSSKQSEEAIYDELKKTAHDVVGWVNVAYPKSQFYGTYNYLDDEFDDGISFLTLHAELFYRSCRVAIRLMSEGAGGSIVNFGSIYGQMGPDMRIYSETKMHNAATYAMAKEAIVGLTRYVSTCFAQKNIRCNAVCPGGVFDKQDGLFVNRYSERVPLGRMALPEEVADATFFLISEQSSYITGQILMVDGGLSAW